MRYKTILPFVAAPVLITAEHAANAWPKELEGPNFSGGWKGSHIAYDKGTASLAVLLSENLNCSAVLGEYTRLLIDLNRKEDADDLIATQSDGIELASNKHLTKRDIEDRKERYYRPYHQVVGKLTVMAACA